MLPRKRPRRMLQSVLAGQTILLMPKHVPSVVRILAYAVCAFVSFTTGAQLTIQSPAGESVRSARTPPTDASNKHYVSNRPPLKPSPFVKLPIGSIKPKGWLRETLELQANGMVGHLPAVAAASPPNARWTIFQGNAWASPEGKGHSPWEETPYWLKGYGDLGYVLNDERIMTDAKRWVDGILSSQREDGWFGPRELLTRLDGKPDLWPNMIALNVLQSWHEFSGDERVPPFMANYFRWQLKLPDGDFLAGYWPKMRGGDNLESVYWLYNRTGEKWLLDLAQKIHRLTARWDEGIINPHGVNITQGFREPAEYWVLSGDEKHRKQTYANYDEVMKRFGQMPGGMFVADENFRPGHHDPRGGAETCSMVEFMHSFEMLTRITGDAVWLDRCEDVAFNSLPAALTPDQKGLHYVTCPNQVRLDPQDKSPAIQNGGTMFSYSPFQVYRCCQHNVSHGWPYYAEEAWLATSDNGLAPALYAPSEVTAKVGRDGAQVTITEETGYPFGDTINFKVAAARPVKFPLYLRVPGWCRAPALVVVGQPVVMIARGGYIVLDREWKDGDAVTLKLPMDVTLRQWAQNGNSVSVDRGPVTYSLAIGEKWEKYGGTQAWPEWQVLPTSDWNYGLVLDEKNLAKSFEVVPKKWAPDGGAKPPVNPLNRYDVELVARARKIPNWVVDEDNVVGALQPSPVNSTAPEEKVRLIPMGAARLRITAFPFIATGQMKGNEWKKTVPSPVSASHVFSGDTAAAMIDGWEPKKSADTSLPRFTWWDRKGSEEWVQHEFETPRKVSAAKVYWFDDGPLNGGCRVPQSWKLLYRDAAGKWQPVQAKGSYGVEPDKYNTVSFEPVETTAVRLQVQLRPKYSSGILEWRTE